MGGGQSFRYEVVVAPAATDQTLPSADFFKVSVKWMRRDNRLPPVGKSREAPSPDFGIGSQAPGISQAPPNISSPFSDIAGAGISPLPSLNPAPPGSAASFFWLANRFVMSIETQGLRFDKQSLEYLAHSAKHP